MFCFDEKIVYVILVTQNFLLSCQGLRCWHCLNQSSNRNCLRNGKLIECSHSERAYSLHLPHKNTLVKNEILPNSYRCEQKPVASVCWCCCDTDGCNKNNIHCENDHPRCQLPRSPENGILRCRRHDHSIGTNCFYRCRFGFYRVGPAKTTCLRTSSGIHWSSMPPVCKPVECTELSPPVHGSIACSNGKSAGSVCRFSCDTGYRLIGVSRSRCGRIRKWTASTPACSRVNCRINPSVDSQLQMECTDGNKLGSSCRFSCPPSYEIEGINLLTCRTGKAVAVGRWSGKFPTCSRSDAKSECPPLIETENLSFECTDDNNRGSTCEMTCPTGMILEIDDVVSADQVMEVTCGERGWSVSIPRCRRLKCPSLPSIDHGEFSCSDEFNLNSECEYRCGEGFRLFGNDATSCLTDEETGLAFWSNNAPKCFQDKPEPPPGACPNHGEIANGILRCFPYRYGNGTHWLPQTTCRLRCTGEFYSPIGERSRVSCTSNGWVGEPCCDICLSTPRLDVVILLDSSNANEESWEASKGFLHDFALFITRNFGYLLNIHIISYASTVDYRSRVTAPNIHYDNYREMFSFTQFLPFVGTGESNTGLALRYVNDEVLGGLEEGSVPLVVLVTNRRPNDMSIALIEAQKMREIGVHIRVVPLISLYLADPGPDIRAFEEITGQEPNSVVNSNSIETFYEDATAGVDSYEKYCDDRLPAC